MKQAVSDGNTIDPTDAYALITFASAFLQLTDPTVYNELLNCALTTIEFKIRLNFEDQTKTKESASSNGTENRDKEIAKCNKDIETVINYFEGNTAKKKELTFSELLDSGNPISNLAERLKDPENFKAFLESGKIDTLGKSPEETLKELLRNQDHFNLAKKYLTEQFTSKRDVDPNAGLNNNNSALDRLCLIARTFLSVASIDGSSHISAVEEAIEQLYSQSAHMTMGTAIKHFYESVNALLSDISTATLPAAPTPKPSFFSRLFRSSN